MSFIRSILEQARLPVIQGEASKTINLLKRVRTKAQF